MIDASTGFAIADTDGPLIAELSETDRAILDLMRRDLAVKEIAKLLAIGKGAAKSRMKRARAALAAKRIEALELIGEVV